MAPMSQTALTWLALAAVLGLWVLGAYNRTTALRAAILAAWAQIEQALALRSQALTELLVAVALPLASEAAAIEAVASAQTQVLAATDAMRRRPVAQETVAELSKALVSVSPDAIRACKRLVQDVAGREMDDALMAYTVAGLTDSRESEQGKEGVQSFLQKRKPNWLL